VSREAWLLHLADQASAKIESITDAVRSGSSPEADWVRPAAGWRREVFYVPVPPTPVDAEDESAKATTLGLPRERLAPPAPTVTLPAATPAPAVPTRGASMASLALVLPTTAPHSTPRHSTEDDDACPF
jgi:hypothetical protein